MNPKKSRHSKLYDHMIEAMQLQSFALKTQYAYFRAVRKVVAFYDDKSPWRIPEEEFCQYFLHRRNVEKWSPSACRIALCRIEFSYQKTLNRKWATAKLIKPKREDRLTVVLSVEEVRRVLKCIHPFRHYAILATIYSCGLRVTIDNHVRYPADRTGTQTCDG